MLLTHTYTNSIQKRDLFQLDNAGKLYPAVSTTKWSAMFRLAAVMKEEINPQLLQKAVDKVMLRFPTMNVKLDSGLFWYYLKKNPEQLIIQKDIKAPCTPISWRNKNAHLLRVLYNNKRIAVEFFHAVTDGSGGMVFLKTLIAEYLRLNNIFIPYEEEILNPATKPSQAEVIDAYKLMPFPKKKSREIKRGVYHFPGKNLKTRNNQSIAYSVPVFEIKNRAKTFGVTITEYLAAAILYIGYIVQTKTKHKKLLPIRVSVPVNMRRFFPTKSLRNCSWMVYPEIIPPFNDLTFEEIAKNVKNFMSDALLPENLFAGIAPNVANEKNIIFKLLPLPVKNFILRIVFKIISNKSATETLSNLGVFTAPDELMEHIVSSEFVLGHSKYPATGAAVITTKDTMRITFTSNKRYPILTKEFENLLQNQGIKISKEQI